jgi:hypothetical protein
MSNGEHELGKIAFVLPQILEPLFSASPIIIMNEICVYII